MRKFLVFICLFGLLALSAAAQDEELPEGCDVAGTIAVIAELAADTQLEPLDVLRAIHDAVNEALMTCEGLSFTSEEEGRMPVLGPITFEEGLWRLTVETSGYMVLQLTVMEGDCAGTGAMAFSGILLNKLGSTSGDKAQVVVESTGCDALLEMSNVNADWTMTVEKLR